MKYKYVNEVKFYFFWKCLKWEPDMFAIIINQIIVFCISLITLLKVDINVSDVELC